MRGTLIPLLLVVLALALSPLFISGAAESPGWSMNASIIEACSCPMFCQCYFNSEPSGHTGHGSSEVQHYCRFNNAFQVNRGHYGETKLDGAKFWVAGDLGGDFSEGQMDWAALTFDPAVTAEQREGVQTILGKLYPVKWNSFTIADDADMEWQAGDGRAVARLGGGSTAEVVLQQMPGMADEPVVIRNLKYWGAPRNDGFVLMPNEVEAYRAGDRPFEFRGTNGFMITFDISSADFE